MLVAVGLLQFASCWIDKIGEPVVAFLHVARNQILGLSRDVRCGALAGRRALVLEVCKNLRETVTLSRRRASLRGYTDRDVCSTLRDFCTLHAVLRIGRGACRKRFPRSRWDDLRLCVCLPRTGHYLAFTQLD